MGNTESIYERETLEHDFVGRESDIEAIWKVLHSDNMIKVLTISGIMKIGNSRLVKQLIIQKEKENVEEFRWCYIDFNDNIVDTVADIYCCIENLLKTLDIPRTRDVEEPQIVKQGKCLKCKQNGETEESKHCDHLAKQLKQLINLFKETTNKFDTKVILCLDNADDVIESGVKDIVQCTIRDIGKGCKNVKIVLTSTHKIGFTDKCCKVYELGPLTTVETVELIHIVTDRELLPEDDIFVEAIAKLCNGLPSAAIMAGSELKADDYLYSPSDMVEILIMGRLSALSPDIYMADDRLDNFKEPIKKIEKTFKDCLNLSKLSENLSGDEFYIDQILEMMTKESRGSAIKLLKPWIEQHVVTVRDGKKKQFYLSGVFRECLSSLKIIEGFANEELHETVLKIMVQNANTVGITCNNEALKCPKNVALEVQRLKNKEDHISVENDSGLQIRDGPTYSKETLNSGVESTVENVTMLSFTKKPGSGDIVYKQKAVEHSLAMSGTQAVSYIYLNEVVDLKECPGQPTSDPDTNIKYSNSLNSCCSPKNTNESMLSIEQQGRSAMSTMGYKIQNTEPQSPEFLPRGECKLNEPAAMVDFKPIIKCNRYVPLQPMSNTNNQEQPLTLTLQTPIACGCSSQTVRSSTNGIFRSCSPLDLTMKKNNGETVEPSINRLDRSNCPFNLAVNTKIDAENEMPIKTNGHAKDNSNTKTKHCDYKLPQNFPSTEGRSHVDESKPNHTQLNISRNDTYLLCPHSSQSTKGEASYSNYAARCTCSVLNEPSIAHDMSYGVSKTFKRTCSVHNSSESRMQTTCLQSGYTSSNNLEISNHSDGPSAMSYVYVDRLTDRSVSCPVHSRSQLAKQENLNNLNNMKEIPKKREKILNIP